ncbi:Zinc finger protein 678 [Eumeta japonica]|uniref:Zinc finger protein 678 n=1 Tax=Eumeta variegata TaxID=151549 RepID=A0A4C1Z026_EUMVA|nr:Zinc finger protein 678 [Eumeta japonica]
MVSRIAERAEYNTNTEVEAEEVLIKQELDIEPTVLQQRTVVGSLSLPNQGGPVPCTVIRPGEGGTAASLCAGRARALPLISHNVANLAWLYTLIEYRRKVTTSTVAFHPVSENSGDPLPFSPTIVPILHPIDMLFPPTRPATHCYVSERLNSLIRLLYSCREADIFDPRLFDPSTRMLQVDDDYHRRESEGSYGAGAVPNERGGEDAHRILQVHCSKSPTGCECGIHGSRSKANFCTGGKCYESKCRKYDTTATLNMKKISNTTHVFRGDKEKTEGKESVPPDYGTSQSGQLKVNVDAEKKAYKCGHCEYATSDIQRMKIHMRTHKGKKSCNCGLCGYRASYLGDLKRHMRIHMDKNPHKCEQCDYRSMRFDSIKRHMSTHVTDAPYKCEQCNYSSSGLENLKQHMRNHTVEKPYKCELCEFSSVRFDNMQRHVAQKHKMTPTTEKLYKCERCDYSLASLCKLKEHMRTHTGDRPYKCEQCEYSASRRSNLHRHMQTHGSYEPYKCEQCDYSASRLDILKRHMLIHMDENPYKCQQCEYHSIRFCDMKRHLSTHEYECGPRTDELSAECLLYADDRAFLTPSTCGLWGIVNKMNDSVKKRGIKVNVGKTNVMVFETGESATECDILIEGERVEQKNRCRNSGVRERCGLKEDVVTGVEGGILRWSGHPQSDRVVMWNCKYVSGRDEAACPGLPTSRVKFLKRYSGLAVRNILLVVCRQTTREIFRSRFAFYFDFGPTLDLDLGPVFNFDHFLFQLPVSPMI